MGREIEPLTLFLRLFADNFVNFHDNKITHFGKINKVNSFAMGNTLLCDLTSHVSSLWFVFIYYVLLLIYYICQFEHYMEVGNSKEILIYHHWWLKSLSRHTFMWVNIWTCYICHYACSVEVTFSLRFSSHSEANASEWLENLEEMFPRYW